MTTTASIVDNNPYAPPKASLTTRSDNSAEKIHRFPRFTTWAVIGLSIITLGFYLYYWLWTRTRILNRVRTSEPISLWLCSFAVALFLMSIGLGFVEGWSGSDPNSEIAALASFVNLVSNICMLVWVFKFRNRLNRVVEAEPGTPRWASGLATFFFQVLYLSYKVNQHIDEAPRGSSYTPQTASGLPA